MTKPDTFDLIAFLEEQKEFSRKTFGPGARADGVLDHISKEIEEVRKAPDDLSEWIDIVLLGLDGASRQGYSSVEIASALRAKLEKNKKRQWPDWRTQDLNKAITHIKH